MIIIITIIVSLIIIGIIVNSNVKKRAQTLLNTIHETVALYNDEANAFIDILKSGAYEPLETTLNLKSNEVAILSDENVNLVEERVSRSYQSGHAGIRLARGVYIGGSKGQSVPVSELKIIDSGKLILTNKRLVFVGDMKTREFKINKIVNYDSTINDLCISYEGREKKTIFTNINNPIKWDAIISLINSGGLTVQTITEEDDDK